MSDLQKLMDQIDEFTKERDCGAFVYVWDTDLREYVRPYFQG